MSPLCGGKKYGEGMKGSVQDTSCMKNDSATFCDAFAKVKDKINRLVLFTCTGKITLKKPKDFSKVLDLLKTASHIVTKTFHGRDPKTAFKNELRSNLTIIKVFKDAKHHHTISHGFLWHKKPIYGMMVVADDTSFHIFSEGCSTQIMHIKFTQRFFDKFVKEIGETLDIIQDLGYQHHDIKPDNMIYCKHTDRFKIIDWELVTHESAPLGRYWEMGNTLFNHPIKFYLGGLPAFIAKRLPARFAVKKNKYHWVEKLQSFEHLNLLTTTSFDYLVKKHSGELAEKVYKRYMPHLDKYAFGQSIVLLADKNKVEIPIETVRELMAPLLPRPEKNKGK